MPRAQAPVYALNGGEVDKSAVARLDLERMRFSGEIMDNAFPFVIGKFQFRPGFERMQTSLGMATNKRLIEFVDDVNTSFLIELSNEEARIIRNGVYVQNEAVTATVQNGDFGSFTGWTDESTGGSANAAVSGGQLVLAGDQGFEAIAEQDITINEIGTEHTISLNVNNGPVQIEIGTSSGESDLLSVNAEDGSHALTFTPTVGTVYLRLVNSLNRTITVNSCQFLTTAAPIVLEAPWTSDVLPSIRYSQSIDVLFVASEAFQQRRIERRGDRSFSIVRYKTDNGPFTVQPLDGVTLTPGALNGTTTLTSSQGIFSSEDVGSLYQLIHFEQRVTNTFSAEGDATDDIRVIGVTSDRIFTVTITGTFTGTIVLERAFNEPENFTEFQTYTAATTQNVDDDRDNQVVFYRLRASELSSGNPNVELFYSGGTTRGVARVVGFNSATSVEIDVLSPFGSTAGTVTWDRGSWSDRAGWPNTVALFDGRLWWGRGDIVYGSVSDAFNSYDDTVEGDSGPVIRSIGPGPERGVVWLLPTQRLLAGTDLSEVSIRASSFDEPITPTNFVPRDASTRGCANLQAVKIDSLGIFVQRGDERVFQLSYDSETGDYASFDLTELHPQVCESGIRSISVQRNPDTRVWFVLNNGQIRCLTIENSENVLSWSRVTTDGTFDDVVVVPGSPEDQVFVLVTRQINGSPVQSLERLASTQEARGGTVNKIMDSFVEFNQAASSIITGLDHLEGKDVIVWSDGAIEETVNSRRQARRFTVTGGQIDVGQDVTQGYVGLPYTGRWLSTKLAYGSGLGTALLQRKRVSHLGLYMVDVILDGVQIGRNNEDLVGLHTTFEGAPVTSNMLFSDYDFDASQFNGEWFTDARINIIMNAPYPVSVSALVISMKTNDQGG